MTTRMVAEGVVQPLRRLLGGWGTAPAVAGEQEHLHYDRAARAWLTHAELRIVRTRSRAEGQPELAGCA